VATVDEARCLFEAGARTRLPTSILDDGVRFGGGAHGVASMQMGNNVHYSHKPSASVCASWTLRIPGWRVRFQWMCSLRTRNWNMLENRALWRKLYAPECVIPLRCGW